ncbi:uncharacterized protein NPIL_91291 [Nephila pilipes]|uniref:Uncharacterized protein n=1 Tax=Nephila pilipes TaxID=299642 RepID=A0A8X6NXR3_NEPPI|nr:uncharacterized protein NPIL_91291 [Nephila pilipes]
MMRGFSAFTLLIIGWASVAEAGDACAMLHIPYCNCTEYHIKINNETRGFNASEKSRAIAPTTDPKSRDPYQQTIVQCNLEHIDRMSLDRITTSLYRKLVDKLSVKNIPFEKEQTLARLPNMWLKDVRVKQFEISDSVLSGDFIWNGNPFTGQEHTLMWFSAVRCSLTGALTYDSLGTMNIKGLENLPRLEGIDLSQNHLVTIQKSAFSHIHRKLKTIVLSRNVIQEVLPGSFHGLKTLQHIDLSHNMLENISRDVFNSEPKFLRRINLSWNRMQSLPTNIFSSMPALKVVDVSFNYLYSLPEEPWKSIWSQLQFIDITNNFIECDCNLLWLVSGSNVSEIVTPRRRIKGQCSRSLPSLFVQHFDLDSLTMDNLDCDADDEEVEDYDYLDRIVVKNRKKTERPYYFTTPRGGRLL